MTKYHETQLQQEIDTVLDRLQANSEPLRPQWVTHEICAAHRIGLVPDHDLHVAFWEYAGYTITRKISTERINARVGATTAEADEPDQPRLPYDGFERQYLQDYYVVSREGEAVGIPTRDLTKDEISARASLFRKQSRRLDAHAAELERFSDFREAHRATA